ncbi:MAG: restriction endonuclease subunit S [Dehalococcoidales bacterium]|nr:restriction endonuclease subunit S [Dehalococcoidales bacterium]
MINNITEVPEGFKMTELGALPEKWEIVPFSDSILKVTGFTPKPMQRGKYQATGAYPIIDQSTEYIAGYTDENDKVYFPDWPLIIFGDHTRIFKYVDFPFAIGADGTKILKPNLELFAPKYLFYNLVSLNIPSRGYNRHFKLLKETTLVKPPLPEQKAIAKVLSTIQSAIEAQDKIIYAAKHLKKSLMKHLFTYGPVQISEAENVQLKETEIGPVPEHWEVVRLIDVAESKSDIVGGPFGSNLKVSDYKDSGVPIIRLQNIERNRFINKDIKFISEAKAKQLEYHSYYPGDIVLAKLGDPIGKTCMVPNDLRAGIVIADVVRIRTNSCFTNKRFIVYALNTELCTTQFRSQKTGTTRPRVNVSNVRNIKIPLPPLKEQQEIASILSTIDKKIEAEENRKNALQSLFKTMLHHLMTGKVRVKDLEETAS